MTASSAWAAAPGKTPPQMSTPHNPISLPRLIRVQQCISSPLIVLVSRQSLLHRATIASALYWATAAIPTLVYDGDCAICRYWVTYWQGLVNGRVAFRPYQQAAAGFATTPAT